MCNSVSSHNFAKYAYSLSQFFNGQPLDLIHLIQALTPFDTLTSLQDLVDKIKQTPSNPSLISHIQHQMQNLIFKQFPEPVTDSIREIISNGLDAQARAHTTEDLSIHLEKDKLIISDAGDGMGFDNLINFFVPSRSSNPQAIFDLNQSLDNVTGRFGQGAASIYYLLLYHTRNSTNPIPTFSKNAQEISLRIPYLQDGKSYEALFCYDKTKQIVELKTFKKIRKISIDTYRHGKSLKIKFQEQAGKIYVDILVRQNPSRLKGTKVKIQSPLLEIESKKIAESIQDTFHFVRSHTIQLNQQKINAEILLKTLHFTWGTVYFPSHLSNQKYRLVICEGGKKICDYNSCPEEVVLDFNRLHLTHERKCLNFNDAHSSGCIKQLFATILNSEKFSLKEKSILLNVFYVLIEQFNLKEFARDNLNITGYRKLPNLAGFEKVADQNQNTLLLDPGFIFSITEIPFYRSGSLAYYWIDGLSTPIVVYTSEGQKQFFLNSQLNFSDKNEKTIFNLLLFNTWLEQRKILGQIPSEQLLEAIEQFPSNHTNDKLNSTSSFLIDFNQCKINYESNSNFTNPDSFEIAKQKKELTEELKQSLAIYPNEVVNQLQPFILGLINNIGIYFFKNKIQYVSHVMCQHEELKFLTDERISIPIYNLIEKRSLEEINYLFLNIKKTLTLHPSERMMYQYYIYCILMGGSLEEDIKFIYNFWKWKKLMEVSNYPKFNEFPTILPDGSKHTLFFLEVSSSPILLEVLSNTSENYIFQPFQKLHRVTDDQILLMSKIQTSSLKKDLFLYLGDLEDISYLLEHPLDILETIISFCNNLRIAIYKSRWRFSKKTYEKIITLVNNFSYIEDVKYRNDCIQAFFIFDCLESLFYPLTINWDCLKLYFDQFNRSKSTENKINITDIYTTIAQLIKLHDTISSIEDIFRNPASFDNNKKMSEITSKINNPKKFQLLTEWMKVRHQRPNNPVALRNKFLSILEELEHISPHFRGFINAALNYNVLEFCNQDFVLPEIKAERIALHKDPDVLALLKNENLAASRIQNALKQTSQPDCFAGELIKNSLEAGAKNINIQLHLHADLFVSITDDGRGMGFENIQALKTPLFTTKRKEENNPNYGWGFFTALAEFDAITLSTSQDGSKLINLHFEKKNGILTIQQATSYTPCSVGTKITLRKKSQQPCLDFINLKTTFQNFCRYIKNAKIEFQDILISGYQPKAIAIKHTEILSENGVIIGPLELQVSETEGIFFHDMRLSAMPETAYHLLPVQIKESITKQSKHFSVSLPKLEQNMNRNLLLNNKNYITILQRGIFAIGLKFYLNECLITGNLPELSEDFWNNFSLNYDTLASNTQKISNAIIHRDWNETLNLQNNQEENLIIESARSFFQSQNTTTKKLSLLLYDQEYSLQQALQLIKNEHSRHNLPTINDLILALTPRALSELLMHLPLIEDGKSLALIRNNFKLHLSARGFIDSQGIFTSILTNQTKEMAFKALKACFTDTCKILNLNEHYTQIGNHFINSILAYIQGTKNQQIHQTAVSTPFLHRIGGFCQLIAEVIIKHKVEVIFYEAADNRNAYTYRGTNKIWLNIKNPAITHLSRWFDNKTENQLPLKSLIDLLVTLSHEITHQQEDKGCSTHDETFYKLLCKTIEKLFYKSDSLDYLKVFKNL